MSQPGDWSGLQILGGWKPQAFDSPSGAFFIFHEKSVVWEKPNIEAFNNWFKTLETANINIKKTENEKYLDDIFIKDLINKKGNKVKN